MKIGITQIIQANFQHYPLEVGIGQQVMMVILALKKKHYFGPPLPPLIMRIGKDQFSERLTTTITALKEILRTLNMHSIQLG